jgi:hypothetical protein
MVARITHRTVKLDLFISLFLSFIAIIGFNSTSNAQGWTFTFQLAQSGPCPPGAPLPILPTFPNFGIPTQGQCEALRQTILSINSSFPVTDNKGNYIGDCSIFYTCTPCTGSDISTPGQVNPGEVSFNGQYEGEAFFTTHESSAFEDWSKDYRQQLASYGITSILDQPLNAFRIPLTGDPDFDAFYNNQTANFNPTTSPVKNSQNLDASVVDLSGKVGVVQLLRSPEEQSILERQYQTNLESQGYEGLTQMDPDNSEIFDGPVDNENKKVSNAALAEFTTDAIGDIIGTVVGVLVPEAGLPSFIQSFGTNLAQATPANIQSGLNAISGTGSPNDVKDPGQLVVSSYINTCTLCKWALTPIKY